MDGDPCEVHRNVEETESGDAIPTNNGKEHSLSDFLGNDIRRGEHKQQEKKQNRVERERNHQMVEDRTNKKYATTRNNEPDDSLHAVTSRGNIPPPDTTGNELRMDGDPCEMHRNVEERKSGEATSTDNGKEHPLSISNEEKDYIIKKQKEEIEALKKLLMEKEQNITKKELTTKEIIRKKQTQITELSNQVKYLEELNKDLMEMIVKNMRKEKERHNQDTPNNTSNIKKRRNGNEPEKTNINKRTTYTTNTTKRTKEIFCRYENRGGCRKKQECPYKHYNSEMRNWWQNKSTKLQHQSNRF
jgi:hypothetical protein